MIVTPQQFAKLVEDLGLATGGELNAIRQKLPDRFQNNTRALAQRLLQLKKLTRYQAEALCLGKPGAVVLKEYLIRKRIGTGGMGVVLGAVHRRMNRMVAIKVLSRERMRKPHVVDRFYREVQSLAKLQHPNVVTALDAGEYRGAHYLVMEMVAGKDLEKLVDQQGPLPIHLVVDFILQSARGLRHAHSQGLIHRDVKPSNLLLNQAGTIKIVDFGLAMLATEKIAADRITQTGEILGTADFLSPEQATDPKKADARSDVYSLGCTMYQLLTGSPVFPANNLLDKVLAHVRQKAPSLRSLRPDVSASLDAIFQKMIAKQPKHRQQSMCDVISDLENLRSQAIQEPVSSPDNPVQPETISMSRDQETIVSRVDLPAVLEQ